MTNIEQQLRKIGYARGNEETRWYAAGPGVPCVQIQYDVHVIDERINVVQTACLYRTTQIGTVAVFDNVPDFIRYCGDYTTDQIPAYNGPWD
jgi:hypothetical protein